MSTNRELATLAKTAIDNAAGEFARALPRHVPTEKFTRVVQTAVLANPDLLTADRQSLLQACMKAAQDGLLPDGREGALAVYNTKVKVQNQAGGTVEKWMPMVQWMPMVAGLRKLARNSGEIDRLSAHVVYERDEFRVVLGDEEKIEHTPSLTEDRGKAVFVYAVARMKSGEIIRDWMDEAAVNKRRDASKTKGGQLWTTWWEEAWKKTVTRRLCKVLPLSTDKESAEAFMRAATREDEFYDMNATAELQEKLPPPRGNKLEQFAEKHGAGTTIEGEVDGQADDDAGADTDADQGHDAETGEVTDDNTDATAPTGPASEQEGSGEGGSTAEGGDGASGGSQEDDETTEPAGPFTMTSAAGKDYVVDSFSRWLGDWSATITRLKAKGDLATVEATIVNNIRHFKEIGAEAEQVSGELDRLAAVLRGAK